MDLRLIMAALVAAAAIAGEARATSIPITFSGPGVSGALTLTYGTAADAKYPNAYEVTGISGSFSDSNNGLDIADATIGSLVPLMHAAPDSTNHLAPNDFSKFSVASGLPPQASGALTYDNLVYPDGSPQTATNYPPHGGVLDIYGLLFNIGGGEVVNFWSNGVGSDGAVDYGVAVATSSEALDYVSGGVSVPEPSSLWLLGIGLLGTLGMFARRRHAATA